MQKWVPGPKSTFSGSAAGVWYSRQIRKIKKQQLVNVMASYVARNLVKSPAALGLAQQQAGESSWHCQKKKQMHICVQFVARTQSSELLAGCRVP